MYLGRFRLGDWIPFSIACYNATRVPVAPDAAPTLRIFDNAGTSIVSDDSLPSFQLNRRTGLFQLTVQMNANPATDFAVGQYVTLIEWTASAFDGKELRRFELVDGGHLSGAYQQIYEFNTPQAKYIVGHTDADVLESRKNPRV